MQKQKKMKNTAGHSYFTSWDSNPFHIDLFEFFNFIFYKIQVIFP